MRTEVEQAYQDGGDVYGPPEPETAIPVNQLIERVVDPKPGQNLQSMIIEHRDQALERLRAGQDSMQQRHVDQRKEAQGHRRQQGPLLDQIVVLVHIRNRDPRWDNLPGVALSMGVVS